MNSELKFYVKPIEIPNKQNIRNDCDIQLLYPGIAGIINQSIADEQKLLKINQSASEKTDCNDQMIPDDCHMTISHLKSENMALLPKEPFPNISQFQRKIDFTQFWPYSDLREVHKLEIKPENILSQDIQKQSMNTKEIEEEPKEINLMQTQNISNTQNIGIFKRLIYSREELISLEKIKLSQVKPNNLPTNDELAVPIIFENKRNDLYISLKPVLKYSNLPRLITLEVTVLPLLQTENRYIIPKEKIYLNTKFNKCEAKVRQIKNILNKIVPQNLEQCFQDLISLEINNQDDLIHLVNEIFIKAINEKCYNNIYAEICFLLSCESLKINNNKEESFRILLQRRCHEMFMTPLKEQLEQVQKNWLSEENIQTRTLLKDDLEEQLSKTRDRYYGNILFIGELYLKGLISTEQLFSYMDILLSQTNDPKYLIYLCKLLEMCGSNLECELKGQQKLDDICAIFVHFIKCQEIESRVRFRIIDILGVRKNKWLLGKLERENKMESIDIKITECKYSHEPSINELKSKETFNTVMIIENPSDKLCKFNDYTKSHERQTLFKDDTDNLNNSKNRLEELNKIENRSILELPILHSLMLYNPDQLLQEYFKTNNFCESSWNSCTNKIDVIVKWLDNYFETTKSKRQLLGHLLSSLINQEMVSKNDLLQAFSTFFTFLEDLIIDIGNNFWEFLSDYIIPFINSMTRNSVDIVEGIFNSDLFHSLSRKNVVTTYYLPWSWVNVILNGDNCNVDEDIFKVAISYNKREKLSECGNLLLDIINDNLMKAVTLKVEMKFLNYSKWFNSKIKEAVTEESREYFLIINWTVILLQITPTTRFDGKFKMFLERLMSSSSSNTLFYSLRNIYLYHGQNIHGLSKYLSTLNIIFSLDILCKLWYIIKSAVFDFNNIINSEFKACYEFFPPELSNMLVKLKSKNIYDEKSFESIVSFISFYESDD